MTEAINLNPRRPGWVLAIIITGLLVSGLLRFGGGEFALAQESGGALDGDTPRIDAGVTAESACLAGKAPGPLLVAIRDRQALLDEREARFEDRMQALTIAEQRVKDNIKQLVAAEKKLAATLAIADKAAEKDLARLTSVYENMKAKTAASLFSEMAPEFAAGFLGRMRADAAAGIMSNLEPGKAYTISLVLAGRNAGVPQP
jgi:flagellar motility protein MotE (MotC chaperone)